MSKLSEYAETFGAEGFKRQLEQEENVVRSLAFVIAGAALVSTLMRAFRPRLCKFDPHAIASLALYGDAVLMALAMIAVLYGMFLMIRPYRYQYPMDETGFLRYVDAVKSYYGTSDAADQAALADVRETITEQLALAAGRNRLNNQSRLSGRAIALNGLALLITLAFAMVCMIYLRHVFEPGACHA
jgi:hypothetical protein